MTRAEKLEALVGRANENTSDHEWQWPVWHVKHGDCAWAKSKNAVYILLFDHDFARALFGDVFPAGTYESNSALPWPIKYWQYQLQQAVISKDSITYFYEQVFKDA